ncbi:MAG: thiamine biosynthesis protein ApbE [Fluviicola sp.]|nr:MAG: thiamine biosynthesis protein ApbE [Fluviicola sp.]
MQTWKNITRIFIFLLAFVSCSDNIENKDSKISSNADQYVNAEDVWYISQTAIKGNTQGTTFIVKTSEDTLLSSPAEISQLLKEFDLQLSGYIRNSVLSKFNALGKNDRLDISSYSEFKTCYLLSQEIYKRTNGAFDPSVFPLVKAWGFFKEIDNPPKDTQIDSILTFIGFESDVHHTFENDVIKKIDARFELDFNAIAQGLSVDYLAEMLEEKGQENYFIEIGGEIRTKGVNNESKPWIIGIDLPTDDNDGSKARKLENYLSLNNVSVATSGDYRKYYEKDGKRYSHTLNPKTGYPVQHNLLSTTVIAKNTATADGYATAFMTMGVNKSLEFVEENPELEIEVYLLFENDNGRIERAYSKGFKQYFL